jgi:uncharacterized protein YkwD
MTNAEYLIVAGQKYPGAHVCESESSILLMKLAQDHASYMARYQQLGHQNFDQRFEQIYKETSLCAAEIAAESWERQADDPLEDIGLEMFKCWRTSRGHWNIAKKKHKFFGAAMERGINGVYYACIIVAN